MVITRKKAINLGVWSILIVVTLHGFNSFACYKSTISDFIYSTLIFIGTPLIPALISLKSKNPLRAIGVCMFFAPWLVFAFYVDCVVPYEGGGASMIYIAVFLWGTLSGIAGAIIAEVISRLANIQIENNK